MIKNASVFSLLLVGSTALAKDIKSPTCVVNVKTIVDWNFDPEAHPEVDPETVKYRDMLREAFNGVTQIVQEILLEKGFTVEPVKIPA